MPEMFLDHTFSAIGRSSSQHLDALRRQLGVGCDPAFDYSKLQEESERHRKEKAQKAKSGDEAAGGAVSGMEQLRRALRDVVGANSVPENAAHDEEATGPDAENAEPEKMKPQDVRRLREEGRMTYAFKAVPRSEAQKLDVTSRFRAPEAGTYRPKYHATSSVPRIRVRDFGKKDATKSREKVKIEKEIEQLKAEGKEYAHLAQPCPSIVLKEGIPSRPPEKMKEVKMNKQMPRPDMLQSCGIQFHDNSFTAGVLDGDLKTSRWTRQPCFDFGKTSTAREKMREYYFQPGQFKVAESLNAVRPKLGGANIPFDQQTDRPSLTKGIERAGDHLPDRSLSRSCPILTRFNTLKEYHCKSFDFTKYSYRPPLINMKTEYHNMKDPAADAKVLEYQMTHDKTKDKDALYSRLLSPGKFDESISRLQQVQVQRRYGDDVNLMLAKQNLTTNPRSSDLLESDPTVKPSLRPRVKMRDFTKMDGREKEHRYTSSPSRTRDGDKRAAKFLRSPRDGDAKAPLDVLSPLGGGISKLRADRVYDGIAPDLEPTVEPA